MPNDLPTESTLPKEDKIASSCFRSNPATIISKSLDTLSMRESLTAPPI
jgi:hypothetical protein